MDDSYFMEEGCGIFAITLYHYLNNRGKFILLVDPLDEENDFGNYFDLYHVALKVGEDYFDAKGKRSLLDMMDDFGLELSVRDPITFDDFMSNYVGSGDDKPLFPPNSGSVNRALAIIKSWKY